MSRSALFFRIACCGMLAGCFSSQPKGPSPAPAPASSVTLPTAEVSADAAAPAETPPEEPASAEHADATPIFTAAQIEESSERLLILTPQGPLLARVYITLDGAPLRLELSEKVDKMLAAADVDDDGEALWEEAASSEAFDVGPFAQKSESEADRAAMIRASDRDRDGQVDRQEIRRLLSRGQKPADEFALEAARTSGDDDVRRSPLWAMLDADPDDSLTAADAAGAAAQLKSRDTDDDDLLYPDELGLAAPAAAMGQPQIPATPRYDEVEMQLVLRLGDYTNWPLLRFTLKEVYAYEGSAVGEAPFFELLGRQLDTNQDGRIASAEVEALSEAQPHVDLELRLFSADDQPSGVYVRGSVDAGAWSLHAVEAAPGALALEGIGVRLRFDASDLTKAVNYQALVDAQFASLDANKDGYLEKTEVPEGSPGAGEQFEAADADSDGKLYPAEMLEYVRQQAAPNARRIRAATAAAGDPLFTWLDASHDGRLSPREWSGAAVRMLALDANGDGRCEPDEIPFGVSLTFTRGAAGSTAGQNTALPAAAMPQPVPAAPSSPAWFLRMDSNGDGDISPREFLGDEEQFQRLDANQDGFIDDSEATPATSSGKRLERPEPSESD